MALPPIVARVTADTTGLVKGLASAQTRLAAFAKIGAAAGAAVAVGLIAMTKASLANIDALAKQAKSLGLTTSAFQRMTLVAEEAGVGMGQLGQMLGLMQRATESGSKAFGELGIALADIQGLAPDEQFAKVADALNKIEDPAKKTNLAMEIFGRSGRAAINMLSDYSAKAADAARFQERFGIAVGQATSDGVERANDAMGRLGQVFVGIGNQLAGFLAPAIEGVANGLIRFAGRVVGAKVELQQFFGTLENARSLLGEDLFGKLFDNPQLIRENTAALEAMSAVMLPVADRVRVTVSALEAFADELSHAGDEVRAGQIDALALQLEQAQIGFATGAISAEEFADKLKDANTKAERLIAGLDGVNSASMSAVTSAVQSLSGALAGAIGRANALRAAMNPYSGLEIVDNPVTVTGFEPAPNAPRTRPKSAPNDIDFDLPPPAQGGGKKGGGGLKDQLAERLSSLMDSLATEAEVLEKWRAESQATLDAALAAKAISEEKYHEARERLAKEYAERLSRIDGAAVMPGIDTAAAARAVEKWHAGQMAALEKSFAAQLITEEEYLSKRAELAAKYAERLSKVGGSVAPMDTGAALRALREWHAAQMAELRESLDARVITEAEYMARRERMTQEHAERISRFSDGTVTGADTSEASRAMADWHAAQLSALQANFNAKLMTEAEYMAEREKLTAEHSERMAAIEAASGQGNSEASVASLQEWYALQLQMLQENLDAKLITETEYMTERERLEQEHQDRMNMIRALGAQNALSVALSGGAEILGAMGAMNKKALKAQKVFAAASALIDTYQGAAKMLRAGTFGFAAAASVIAKGLGFVAAIKGVNEGGGGGGSAGGGAAGAAAPVEKIMNMKIDVTGSDGARITAKAIIEAMTDMGKQGYRINPEWIGR
jgi:hypothetical protein